MATSELLSAMLAEPGVHHHDDLLGSIDMVDDRVTQLERAKVHIDQIRDDVADLRTSVEGATAAPPDIDWDRFARAFRGDRSELRSRYESLADRFVGHGPVVDIGCGDGLFLELLGERGVDAWGVEIDEALVDVARGRDLDVRVGDGVAAVAHLGDASVGGIVSVQVVEHLVPSLVPRLVREARRALTSGGVLVIESPDPRSLYVQTHSFWLDPSHARLVHPLYIDWLCREAGFATVEHVPASAVPSEEQLPIPDASSDPLLGEIVDKLNAVLFAPQDYVVVATA
jgi:O-antigen chain-terminating methyltransferase